MAKKAGKKATVTFERTDGARKRLPTRAEMTQWIEAASYVPFEGAVRFVGDEEGRELNRSYRKKDYATNVLTFDYSHAPVAQADIVIATAVIEREAREQEKSFREHLAHMLIHSVLHAQGWDHLTDEEAEAMEKEETKILAGLGFADPYSDQAKGH